MTRNNNFQCYSCIGLPYSKTKFGEVDQVQDQGKTGAFAQLQRAELLYFIPFPLQSKL